MNTSPEKEEPKDPSKFSIEEVARLPLPGMAIPGSLAFSPDGRWISYLHSVERNLVRQLFVVERSSAEIKAHISADRAGASEENYSAEERLRRERQRQYELGITSYVWAPDSRHILIPLTDGLYLANLEKILSDEALPGMPGDHLELLVSTRAGAIIDPQFSPDGQWVAYVQEGELYALDLKGKPEPRQLTQGARQAGKTHGLAEYIAQEEMGRSRGFWWSPDSQRIAFAEVDESHIPLYRIIHQGMDGAGPPIEEAHRYPFAGAANARIRLGVVSQGGGEPLWMDLGPDQDIYLARVDWLPDGRLAVQIENRRQDELHLYFLDPATGKGELILQEKITPWINLNNLFTPLKDGRFLWGSERSGYQHLYLYHPDGSLIRTLTAGDWLVESMAGVDESNQVAYFTGTRQSPLECHLYAVDLRTAEVKQVSQAPGMHSVVVNTSHGCYLDTHDHLTQPPTVSLRALADDHELASLFTPNDPRLAELDLQPPEIICISSEDGQDLYGALYRPQSRFGAGPYPTIVSVYGGPHAQQVTRGWRMTVAMRAQYLRSLGFLVFVLDNRGSARRGLAFEGVIHRRMGECEVEDQVRGVRWLVAQGLAHPERVGIYGWSYGGYMSLMCLCRAAETFRCAVAGAPVTSWDGYDTHYTERYMATPQENPQGYHQSAVFTHVDKMTGKLLLVHGLIDENVHFRHTARLINHLIRARKPYELLLFPAERHGPRRLEDRIYLEERLRDFFIANLLPDS